MVRALIIAAGVLSAILCEIAAATPYIYTPLSFLNRVDVVDAATHELHDIIPVGRSPYTATLDRTRRHLYVLNIDDQTLSIIDTILAKVTKTVTLGATPRAVFIPDDDTFVYVALEQDVAAIDTVATVDTAAGVVVHTLKPGTLTSLAVSGDGSKLYTYGFLSCKLDIYDTQDYHVAASATFGCLGGDIALDHSSSTLFLAENSSVSFYDAASLKPILAVPLLGAGGSKLTVDSQDRFLYAVGDYSVGVIDIASGAQDGPPIASPVDCALDSFTLSDDGRFAYSECVVGSAIAFHALKIDLSSRSVIDSMVLGGYASSSHDFVGVPPSDLYVANGASTTVSSADPVTAAVGELATVGTMPAAVVGSSDGKRLYVANRASDNISVVSIDSGTAIATIPTGAGPSAVALSPDNARLYVTNETDNTISVVDTTALAVQETFTIHDPNSYVHPRSIGLTRDGTKLFVSFAGEYDIDVIDAWTGQSLDTIYCDEGADSLAVSPDGSFLYASSGGNSGALYQIDPQSDAILNTWHVYPTFVLATPGSIAVSPDGTRVYVGSADTMNVGWYSASMASIDTSSGDVLGYVALDGAPSSLVAGADGRYVYAAIGGNDEISIVDTVTHRATGSLKPFQGPSAIAPVVLPRPNLIFRQGFDG